MLDRSDLIRYMGDVFNTELNIYIQKQLLTRMTNTYGHLGNEKRLSRPKQKTSTVSIGDSIVGSGVVCGIITAVVTFIVCLNTKHGFFAFINSVWTALVLGVVGAVVGGVIVGSVIGSVRKSRDQRVLDAQFVSDNEKYQKNRENDMRRVEKENAQKRRLANDIGLLQDRISVSEKNLRTMYNYGILETEYCNIYAVSSIYGYLKNGRTHCLEFDPSTGDKGAYNIYEEERRMDKIILNTDEIIKKLDVVMDNQFVLVDGLRRAEAQISSLGRGVNDFIFSTQAQLDSIQNSQALIAYNAERTAAEAGVLSWLALTR